MKKMKVNPGVCGFECIICAENDEDEGVTVTVETKCGAVKKMVEALDQPMDGYSVCFVKPGQGPVYEAAVNLAHGACPVASAITKCVEAECGLALPRNTSFEFIEE